VSLANDVAPEAAKGSEKRLRTEGAANTLATGAPYRRRMQTSARWPRAETIETARLMLKPLCVDHADEMILVLGDQRLYSYTGGVAPGLDELRSRYARQVAGQSEDESRGWLNWIIRERETKLAVGTVQATLFVMQGSVSAELAWVVGVAHQGRAYATEASTAAVAWLRRRGVRTFSAHIHPGHQASEGVARHLGLVSTNAVRGGETRWVLDDR
jgi:RimJ/RimL family protein N-acetyltransferase